MKKAILLMFLLVAETAVSSVFLLRIAPYVLLFTTLVVAYLVYSKRLTKNLPIYLYGLGLAAVWQTSMLGTYIVGIDINGEMATVRAAILHGWSLNSADSNSTSFILSVVSPFLSHVINPIWQFKVLYPAMFAAVPMILFFAYRKMLGDRMAFFASLFIMIMPMFTMETPSMVKGLVAQFFLALAIMFLIGDIKKQWVRMIGLSLSLVGVVVSHYTVAFVSVAIIISIFGLKVLASLFKRKTVGADWKVTGVALASVLIAIVGYYSVVGGGGMFKTVTNTVSNVATVDTASDTTLKAGFLERTGTNGSGFYLQNQEPLIQTALGLDFKTASWSGRIFRALQLFTELCIGIGVLVIVFRRKFLFEFIAGVVACMGLILGCVFIPFMSISVSATRFYELSLLFLAPALVIGVETLARGRFKTLRVSLAGALVVAYFLFVSGFVFEVTRSTTVSHIDTPYSFAFSTQRVGLISLPTQGDINAVQWLVVHADLSIQSDYDGVLLARGYGLDKRSTVDEVKGERYVFVTAWSDTHNELITGLNGGERIFTPLPDYQDMVFQSGQAKVYMVS